MRGPTCAAFESRAAAKKVASGECRCDISHSKRGWRRCGNGRVDELIGAGVDRGGGMVRRALPDPE